MILETTDFATGLTRIAQDQNTVIDLQTYITADTEKALLYRIMGKTEADLFIADLTASTPQTPQTAKWTALFSAFTWENGSMVYSNIGLKEILKYYIYFDYVSTQPVINQSGGNAHLSQEASNPEGIIKKADVLINRAYIEATNLQWYMNYNSDTYPNFEAYSLPINSPI